MYRITSGKFSQEVNGEENIAFWISQYLSKVIRDKLVMLEHKLVNPDLRKCILEYISERNSLYLVGEFGGEVPQRGEKTGVPGLVIAVGTGAVLEPRLKVKPMLSEESLKEAQAGEPFVVNQIIAEPVGLSLHDFPAGTEEMVQIDLPIRRYREYELVTPVSTNLKGHYLSHILSANHKKRSPRDVSSNSEQLFFNVTAFGRDFHLRLKPNTHFIAPGAVVEWHETSQVPGNRTDTGNRRPHGSASERIWRSEPLQTTCAYVGDIMDVPGTSVAISNCDGLGTQ
ncbi:hypothetical protein STEG23_014081 [Scotinomys teguina]